MRPSSLFISLFLFFLLVMDSSAVGTFVSFDNTSTIGIQVGGVWFDYVLVVMLENHSINFTYYNGGPVNSCLGNCTYFTSLANSNGLSLGFTDDNITGHSVGRYIAITSGYRTTNIGCDSGPVAPCVLHIPNIVDSLENAHLSWKAYMEGYPTASGCNIIPADYPYYYDPAHNPFIYYADVQNTTRCNNIVRANSINAPANVTVPRCYPISVNNDDLLLNDLNTVGQASNYMFLTPNTVDDNHDCNDVSVGNAWLQQLVPQILNSLLFKTQRAALFVGFDEPTCDIAGCPPAARQIYSVWASNPSFPHTKMGYKSKQPYTHFSQLRTIEQNWMLPFLNATTDGKTNNMQEFF